MIKCPKCKSEDNLPIMLKDKKGIEFMEGPKSQCYDCGHIWVSVPYEIFCINPSKCRGFSSCPRNYACSE